MSALEKFSANAVAVVKLFAYPYRAAPTADIVGDFSNRLAHGSSSADLLDLLFNLSIPQNPFSAYASTSTNATFVQALVENMTAGAGIAQARVNGWIFDLNGIIAGYPSRGAFTMAVVAMVESYQGTDADVLALKAQWATRAETAAAFAQSPAGAVYDGGGFAQLLAPMVPPSYELSAALASVDEGGSLLLTLKTTQVAAGTNLPFTLSGTGITGADLVGGQLTGVLTVDAAGMARATLNIAADATTEGAETLRIALDNGAAQVSVPIADTSQSVVLVPTYALSVDVASVDEGADVVFTLRTTHLAAGSTVAFTLGGSGITSGDLAAGVQSGFFTLDAGGVGTFTLRIAADATTEGSETLRMTLSGGVAQASVALNDTSLTPPPPGTLDVLYIADAMSNSHAGPPATPAEGEMPLNSWLTADLLNQAGAVPVRLSITDLKATGPTAGAPLNTTNRSADRGNIPQVSNQALYTFDLGSLTDRVDYSAESGRITAIVSSQAGAGSQYMLVNDDATDLAYNGSNDRLDLLKNVEELVASKGGGIIDLTASQRDWTISFNRNFVAALDVDLTRDREQRRIELVDSTTGNPWERQLFEIRDAGFDPAVTVPTALWRIIEGSDRNETLIFSPLESQDERAAHLRGGTNAVKFYELTRSILVDVAITPWVAATNAADDTNGSGQVTASTTFTNGDGVTLLGAHTNVTTSHTPDNAIATGVLKLAGSQDAEDTLSFGTLAQPVVVSLGQMVGGLDLVGMRLLSSPVAANALEATGFEQLRDNPATDDVYAIANMARATLAGPKLLDSGADHDVVRLGTDALGSAAVGGAAGTINLSTLNGAAPGFGMDFDVLDLTGVTASALTVQGTAGTDDELVAGTLGTLDKVLGFESLVLTDASIDKGTALVLDLDLGQLKAGATRLVDYTGSVVSAGGIVYSTAGQPGSVAPMTIGMSLSVIDSSVGAGATLWGGAGPDILGGGLGNDTLRGGAANDTLTGGLSAETWTFQLGGTPDAVAAAANRVSVSLSIDGTTLTLSEAAVADTAYGDGNGAFVDGASLATIGQALAALVNANLTAINGGPGNGTVQGASYNVTNGEFVVTFAPGLNANDIVSHAVAFGAGPDSGSFSMSATTHRDGSNGGADTIVFEATGALNGSDTVLDFTRLSDKLNVKAFTGVPINAAGTLINATAGGTLAGLASTVELVFNKAGGTLSSSDFATAAAAAKLVIADGGKCVVAVTADPTGSGGDAANTPVRLYYVENGATAGLGDLTLSLVATLSGPEELSLADIFWGLG